MVHPRIVVLEDRSATVLEPLEAAASVIDLVFLAGVGTLFVQHRIYERRRRHLGDGARALAAEPERELSRR